MNANLSQDSNGLWATEPQLKEVGGKVLMARAGLLKKRTIKLGLDLDL